jgi:hypothetical protein
MTADPHQARTIFLQAVEAHAPDEWGRFLDEACGPDADLRRRVEVLLRAHQQANSLLDAPSLVRADGPGPPQGGRQGAQGRDGHPAGRRAL